MTVVRFPGFLAAVILLFAAALLFGRIDQIRPSLRVSTLRVNRTRVDDRVLEQQLRYITNNTCKVEELPSDLAGGPPLLHLWNPMWSPKDVEMSGRPTISAFLAPAFADRLATRHGMLAALAGACLALILAFNADVLNRFGIVFAAFGAIMTVPLGFGCALCGAFSPQSVLPPTLLLSFAIAACVFAQNRPKIAYLSLAAFFGVIVPLGQGALLMQYPKLCIWCLMIGACSIAVANAALASMRTAQPVTQLTIPTRAFWSLQAFLLVILLRGSAETLGFVKAPIATNQEFSLVGRKLSGIYNGPQQTGLYMVTALSCPPCYSAKDFNEIHGIKVREVPICSIFQSRGCVDGESTGIPTPTYFAVSQDGNIIWSFVGAPAPESQSEFLQQINQVEQSIHDHNEKVSKSSSP